MKKHFCILCGKNEVVAESPVCQKCNPSRPPLPKAMTFDFTDSVIKYAKGKEGVNSFPLSEKLEELKNNDGLKIEYRDRMYFEDKYMRWTSKSILEENGEGDTSWEYAGMTYTCDGGIKATTFDNILASIKEHYGFPTTKNKRPDYGKFYRDTIAWWRKEHPLSSLPRDHVISALYDEKYPDE